MENTLFTPADILLPKKDFGKWSVIACDQFTSKPGYWEEVKKIVGDAPSTLKLIYPEVWLETTDADETIRAINAEMCKYLGEGVYDEYEDSFIYVERIQSDGRLRAGIVGKVDLTQYDYNLGSTSRIRATERTVLERIPPRVKIRENAPTELPHVLMLMDDPEKTVVEPLTAMKNEGKLRLLYETELMLGGGRLAGYLVPKECNAAISASVEALGNKNGGITLAVGDGNHSLASAKACYEKHPTDIARYALVEVMNLHAPALDFESIYRVVTGVEPEDVVSAFRTFLSEKGATVTENGAQTVKLVCGTASEEISYNEPPHALPVGTIQLFLDAYVASHPGAKVDYIHGEDEVVSLAGDDGTVGFLYGGITKEELFPAVAKEGVLPRKTFSMGTSRDKRYYTEVRRIK